MCCGFAFTPPTPTCLIYHPKLLPFLPCSSAAWRLGICPRVFGRLTALCLFISSIRGEFFEQLLPTPVPCLVPGETGSHVYLQGAPSQGSFGDLQICYLWMESSEGGVGVSVSLLRPQGGEESCTRCHTPNLPFGFVACEHISIYMAEVNRLSLLPTLPVSVLENNLIFQSPIITISS